MKNNKILLISLLLMPFSSCKNKEEKIHNELGLMIEDPYFSDENYNPVLRFSVASDIHIGNTRAKLANATKRLLDYAYEIANNSNYKNVDACLFAGDIADTGADFQWNLFKGQLYGAIKENTKPLVVMGNHDFRTFSSRSEAKFSEVFESPTDFHEIINGFHFICMSPSNESGFSNEKVNWLKEELEKASLDNPTKPIFVMQHMNVSNTVIGSKDWGVANLTDVLSKYPQVIDFSGHSHFPMKDPRSIYQSEFTTLGTGTMFYYELGINGLANTGFYPIDEFGGYAPSASSALAGAEFYLVEVDISNAVRITGYDLLTKTKICQYGIKNPSDKSSFLYTSKRYENANYPFFEKNHSVDAAVNSNDIILNISKAYCKDLIESYRVDVYKKDEKINSFYALSGYYLNPMPEKITVHLTDLESKTKYTIKIYAITSYGKANKEALTYDITTI